MKINGIKTSKIESGDDLYKIIDQSILYLQENSIVVFTSKIVSIHQRRLMKPDRNVDKDELIRKEADFYMVGKKPYGKTLTIKDGIIIPDAGIDESNINGYIALWPEQPYKIANEIRSYLNKKFDLKHLGIIITDSKTTPLRWGTTGVGIAYSGIAPLNDYIGTEDLFGREMEATKANILDGLAAAAVLVMGEGKEQTPIAIIEEVPFVRFTKGDPTKEEINELNISPEDDLYAPILTSVKWEKKNE
jgi:putative folate metabolism gamma-glutamate ligase